MNEQTLAALVKHGQSGNRNAMEKLLLHIHGQVSFLCSRILKNEQAAATAAKATLYMASQKLKLLQQPEMFESWVLRIAAGRCVQLLSKGSVEELETQMPTIPPGTELDEAATALAAADAVAALPAEPRLCILLYSCCRMDIDAIETVTGYSADAVMDYLQQALAGVNERLTEMNEKGVSFAPVESLPELLITAMGLHQKPSAAEAMVQGILSQQPAVKAAPAAAPKAVKPLKSAKPAKSPKASKKPKSAAPAPRGGKQNRKILIAVIVAGLLLMAVLGIILMLVIPGKSAEETLPETTQTLPMETTAPTTATTLPETTAPTTEATVPTTEETVETTEAETTESTTEPETEPTKALSTGGAAGGAAAGTGTSTGSGGAHTHSYQEMGQAPGRYAGCESAGYSLKICFVCGDTVVYQDPDNYPAKGHDYVSTVKEPTTSREGYTVHTCYRCGLTYMDNYVPKLEETQSPATEAPAAPEVTPDAPAEEAPEPPAET